MDNSLFCDYKRGFAQSLQKLKATQRQKDKSVQECLEQISTPYCGLLEKMWFHHSNKIYEGQKEKTSLTDFFWW